MRTSASGSDAIAPPFDFGPAASASQPPSSARAPADRTPVPATIARRRRRMPVSDSKNDALFMSCSFVVGGERVVAGPMGVTGYGPARDPSVTEARNEGLGPMVSVRADQPGSRQFGQHMVDDGIA